MFARVCSQNHSHHSPSKVAKLLSAQIFNKIQAFQREDSKSLRCMEMLLNRKIVGIDSPLGNSIGMVAICEPIMPQIMAHCRNQHAHAIEVAHLELISELTLVHQME